MRSKQLLSPAGADCTPGPGQLSGNMCLWAQGGPWEGVCVRIRANLAPLMGSQLQVHTQLLGRPVVPPSQPEGSECLLKLGLHRPL